LTAGPAVLALDIGATKLAAGIGSADGEMTRVLTVPTHASAGAESVLARSLELAQDVHARAAAAGAQAEALGVSTMGYTHSDRVELATYFPGWTELVIPAAVARLFPDLSRRDRQRRACCRAGGDGLGQPARCGRRDLSEPRMAADGIGPFEAWFGGAGAATRVADQGPPASVAATLELAEADAAAREFIDALWTGIAVMTANLCTALNSSVVALGGGYVRDGANASLRGAVALALAHTGAPA
jgi:predicted NBD/HSP70 family sugar kinase